MFTKLIVAWKVGAAALAWLKAVQANAEARLSPEQAAKDRLWLEGVAQNLAEGNLENLPKWLRPLLKVMTLNNVFGRYVQRLLKSEKMQNNAKVLYQSH